MIQKKVLIIGSYPPPYGGVTIHIKRLSNLLSSKGYEINILDTNNTKFAKINEKIFIIPLRLKAIQSIIKSFISSNIVHIHTSGYGKYWREALLITLAKFTQNKVIVTIHGGLFPKYISKDSLYYKFCIKFWLKYSDKIILVNQFQKDAIIKYILSEGSNKIEVIPAFLPEKLNQKAKNQIIKFNKDEYNVLVMGNWMEIYGFDTFIMAVKELIDKGVKIRGTILIYLFSNPDLNYKSKIETLIESNNLKEHIVFLPETNDMVSIYNNTDIFVRPTHTDGDSISVREALSLGIPVIASNVCERPGSVILFKNQDYIDLAEKLQSTLKNAISSNVIASSLEQQNFSDKIVQIYTDLTVG